MTHPNACAILYLVILDIMYKIVKENKQNIVFGQVVIICVYYV